MLLKVEPLSLELSKKQLVRNSMRLIKAAKSLLRPKPILKLIVPAPKFYFIDFLRISIILHSPEKAFLTGFLTHKKHVLETQMV